VRPPFWRRRFIVDPAFQCALIARATIHTLLVLTMVSVGLFGPVLLDLQSPNRIDDGADTAVVMLYMHGRFWWIAGICLAAAIVDSVRVSHRIAGPLVPIKRNLRALGDGRLPGPLRTRPHDYLKSEVEILNAASAGLARRIDALQEAHAATVAELLHCSEALASGGDGAQAHAALTSAQQKARELGQLLAGFERISAREPATAALDVAVAPCHC
jgi:hypothetical protein